MSVSKIGDTLKCGCVRTIHILDTPSDKVKCSDRNVIPIIREFHKTYSFDRSDPIYEIALEETRRYFSDIFYNLRPYHFRDRLDDLRKDTSPGDYYLRKGFKTKAEVLDDEQATNTLRFFQHMVKTKRNFSMAKFPSRVSVVDAYEKAGTIKRRVAWVYPMSIIACENMFYAAIKDRIPDDWVPTPSVYHNRFCQRSSGSADFSAFDSSVPRAVIEDAFSILRSWFDFSTYAGGARPYSKTSLDLLFSRLVEYFIHTPYIINGDPRIHQKHKGVPSGSMFTNVIDTICSRIIITYLHRALGCNATVTTYGDDIHYRDCSCQNPMLERLAGKLGMKLKIEAPNEHGCLTYCKAECHEGKSFHSGTWFANIIDNTDFPKEVAECLLYMEPTLEQARELAAIHEVSKPNRSSWFLKWRDKFFEFWPKYKRLISDL